MTPEQQRIAIAKACGVTAPPLRDTNGSLIFCGGDCVPDYDKLPDYPNDLNACHEMELTIIERGLEMEYREALGDVCGQYQITWHATAVQRCEAFLRTIGKWEETK